MSTNWLAGETMRLSVVVSDSAAVPFDPSALRLKVKTPDGITTTYTYGASGEIVRTAVGCFQADIALTVAGRWLWRWESDAPQAGASEGALSVNKSVLS